MRGQVSWDAESTVGDFILLRSTGVPVYNFCVAGEKQVAECPAVNDCRRTTDIKFHDWPSSSTCGERSYGAALFFNLFVLIVTILLCYCNGPYEVATRIVSTWLYYCVTCFMSRRRIRPVHALLSIS